MSDSPIVFKRTKPKPSQRSRSIASELEDETQPSSAEVAGTDEESHSTIAAKIKKQRKKPKSALSFGGNDEDGQGEVFQAKKSSLSRKLALGRAAALPGSVPSSPPVANESPKYDAKYLSELKASMRSSRPVQPEAQTYDMSYDADTSIVNDISFDGASIDSIDTSLVTETPEIGIPTSSYILDAKKKRDALRKTGATGEDDFISLSVTKRDNNLGPHPESRLVREEDELGEADDEFAEYTSAQERIALGKKAKKLEASKRKELMQAAIDETQEDDAEEMEWEQEQLRRGGNKGFTPESQVPIKAVYKPAPIPSITPIPTLDPAVARITHSLTTLTTSHVQNISSLNSLVEEQTQLEVKEKELREMIERTEAKRSWFVAFREWVEEVANFLDDKFPQLEKLEDEHVSLLKERSEMISDRRRKDDEDDLTLFFGELPQSAEEQSTSSTRQQRSAARIQRRLQRCGTKPPSQTVDEGYSTDSSLPPSESQDFQIALAKLEDKVGDMLSDVRAEGFRDPNIGLKKWFGEWREKYEDIYVGAWGGLGLTGAWEFWARLEIVGWNPFQDYRSLDSFDFYRSLYEYSRSFRVENDHTEGDGELGPEGDLASSMISTAVVPRLCKLIEGGGFDPFSAKDVRTMIDLAEQVEIAVQDRTNLKFQMLLKSVSVAFQNAGNTEKSLLESYLTVNRPRFDPQAIPARKRYLNRRIKLIEGIVRWRKYAGEKFGLGDAVKRIVDGILIPVAERGWEVGGEDCLRKVAKLLPQELITLGLETRVQ